VIYICILLQMLESSVSLLITMKLTPQENFRLAAILLYYIVQKIALTEVDCYLRFYCYTSFQALNLNGSNVALISPVYIFSMLLLTKHLQQ
jgi:hypothetical protein